MMTFLIVKTVRWVDSIQMKETTSAPFVYEVITPTALANQAVPLASLANTMTNKNSQRVILVQLVNIKK